MQTTMIFLGGFLLVCLISFTIAKFYREFIKLEQNKIQEHIKRKILLQKKVAQLFEMDKKHEHNLKVLANEVEKLKQDIAIRAKRNRS